MHQKTAHRAGRCSEGYEDHRKSRDESHRRPQETAAGLLALPKLLHANTREHGDVARHQRQHARREKRNQPSDEGGKYSNFHTLFLCPLRGFEHLIR